MTWHLFAATRKARLGLSLLAAISGFLLWAPSAHSGTTITPMPGVCPVLIAQPGEYDLAGDVGPCPQFTEGIVILASWVTLHLNGHTISGAATNGFCNTRNGIHVGLPLLPMLSQVRVLGDGTISNFNTGFLAENSAGSLVKFVTVNASGCVAVHDYVGFLIRSPGGQWKLQGNVFLKPVGNFRGFGILLAGVDDNVVVRNDVNNYIDLVDSSNNVVVNNAAHDGGGGILVAGFATGSNSNNNEIHANTTNNNGNFGIRVDVGASANNITGNTSFNDVVFDMEDDNPGCDSNKWEGNTFGTANQTCIH